MPGISDLNILSILPIICNLAGGILILLLDLIYKNTPKIACAWISIIALGASLAAVWNLPSPQSGFFELISVYGLAVLSQIIILIASILFIALTMDKSREFSKSAFYALFLLMVVGYQVMVSSSNLVVIFLGLESSSLALYALIALKGGHKAMEAAIKYFTLGALGSGFFAFGILFFYASSGSVDIFDLAKPVGAVSNGFDGGIYFILAGFVFLLGALGFKLSFFPFHAWVPDVYEGSSAPLAFYMSIATKIAAFIVALKVFNAFASVDSAFVEIVLFIIVVLTTTIPNIIALLQRNIQRMLAYSSISQAGFALACILVKTEQGVVAMFLYWILFLFTNLGAFGMLWLTRNRADSASEPLYSDFSGLIKISPLLAVSLGIFMLSLSGIPPFGMFWGKIYVISSAISGGFVGLALILLLNSALAVYYYMKLVVFMFLKEPPAAFSLNLAYQKSPFTLFALFVAFVMSAFALCFIEYFMAIISHYLFNFI